jgi:DNA-binding NarL/FixJ family response regulator
LNRPRILLADDHDLMRERVDALLKGEFEIIGSVNNGKDLVCEAERLKPDIVLSDISMPGLTGIEAARELRQCGVKSKFVFLTVHEQMEFVQACLAEGALGYVLKSRLTTDLIDSIHAALLGRKFISPAAQR